MDLILPQLGLFFWTALLFLAFFLILRRFAWKPILDALSTREEGIENSLREAERAREEMAQLKSQNEELLREAQEERRQLLAEANRMKDKIVTQAREEARQQAQKELEKAKRQIDSEKATALAEIKNTAGQLAIDVAEKVLRRQLDDPAAQRKYADQLISDLSNN